MLMLFTLLFLRCCCCCFMVVVVVVQQLLVKNWTESRKKNLIHNFIKCFFSFAASSKKSFPGTNFQRKNRSSREEDDEDDNINNNNNNSDNIYNNSSSSNNNNNNSDNIYNNSNNVGRILSLFFEANLILPPFSWWFGFSSNTSSQSNPKTFTSCGQTPLMLKHARKRKRYYLHFFC